ncbi:T9SS type A sorting domain-containing protein [Flaviaesturariibacter amylovorans]|uniref:T9SS type A sorting domain-containing protein n=1 Tax=Flaviaesturariibacter amylovorans TaxID=1084520 RepID=A0ABP8GIM1_9BACT
MKKTFTLQGLLVALCLATASTASAQYRTTVAPSNQCQVIEDFDATFGGFRSPSIFTESDYTEFNWDSLAGNWQETSGLGTRSGSLISPVYINQQPSGGIDIGFKYKVCAGAQYRIRIINVQCTCIGGYDIVATTATGPVWTNFPNEEGRLCIRMNDGDLYQGQKFRVEISYRNTTPCNWELDDFSLGGEDGAIILPVTFMGITARKEGAGTRVQWDVADEVDVLGYEIEKSTDGVRFNRVGYVPASKKPAYNYSDAGAEGTVYYRVKNVDVDGKFKYSSVVKLSGGKSSVMLKAFPLPARDQLTVQHEKMANGALVLSTADGRVVRQQLPAPGSIQTNVGLAGLTPGLYILRVDDGNGNVESLKVVKQ